MPTRKEVLLLGAVSVVGYTTGGLWVADAYESLREGPLPIVLVANIVLLTGMLWTMRRLGLGVPPVLAKLGTALALAGLFIVLGFLASVLVLDGLTARLPEWVATFATFVGSLASLLGLPLGLMLVSAATLREKRLARWARPLPLAGTGLLLAVPIAIAIVPEGRLEGQVAAILFAVAGLVWSGYVFGMAATIPASDRRDEVGTPRGAPTTARPSRGRDVVRG